MVEKVVSALSSFRQAAAGANENVRQILRDLMPTVSRGGEGSRELRDTTRANSNSDSETKAATSKSANIAGENASISQEILSELKAFANKFGTLLGGTDENGQPSVLGGILGFGAAAAGLTAISSYSEAGDDLSIDEPEYDLSYDPSATAPYAAEGGGEVTQSQAGIRNIPIDENLLNILSASAAEAGVNVNVVSGGQMSLQAFNEAEGSKKIVDEKYYLNGKAVRTGSTRHDNGGAADLDLLDPNTGQKLEYNNETKHVFHNFMTLTRKYGATGIGFGFGRDGGYMGGDRMHIGFGADAFWGEVHEDEKAISAAIESITPGSKPLPELTKPASVEPTAKAPTASPIISEATPPIIPIPEEKTTTVVTASEATYEKPSSIIPSKIAPDSVIESVSLEPSKLALAAPTPDLASPIKYASTSSTKSGVRTGVSTTPASVYSPPKPTEVAQSGMSSGNNTKPLIVDFDMAWIKEANKETETTQTWVA